jgi:anti-sigma B factor antagonist
VLFAMDLSTVGEWVVIAVIGEIELATAPRLRQQVVTVVGDGQIKIVLDLSKVDFVDSIGLGVIVSALKRVRGRNGDLIVAGPAPRVRALFELTRLDEIVELYASLDSALDPRVRESPSNTPAAERSDG